MNPELFIQFTGEDQNILKPGIYPAMSREDYIRIPAFNQSSLKKYLALAVEGDDFHRCPGKFHHWLTVGRHKDKPSEAMIVGSALDSFLLDGGDFDKRFAVLPENAPRKPTPMQRNAKKPSPETVASVQFWDRWEANLVGRTEISRETLIQVEGMAKALREHKDVAPILSHCHKAVAVAEIAGFPVKAEFDLWSPKSDVICDLKTTTDVSDGAFSRLSWNFGYHAQMAWYLEIANALGYAKDRAILIAIERDDPHWVNAPAYSRGDAELFYALRRLFKAMDAMSERMVSGEWPGYQPFRKMTYPAWATKEAFFGLEEE